MIGGTHGELSVTVDIVTDSLIYIISIVQTASKIYDLEITVYSTAKLL